MKAHTDRMGMAGAVTVWSQTKCLSSAAPAARSVGVPRHRSRWLATACGRMTVKWTVRGPVGCRNPSTKAVLSESMKPNVNASVRARAYGQNEGLLSVAAGCDVVTSRRVLAQSLVAPEESLVGTSAGLLVPDLEDNCFHYGIEKGMSTVWNEDLLRCSLATCAVSTSISAPEPLKADIRSTDTYPDLKDSAEMTQSTEHSKDTESHTTGACQHSRLHAKTQFD